MRTHSNEQFKSLGNEEIARQQDLLRPLREKHERELFDTGLTKRLIGSTAIINQWSNKDSLTEGSIIYPYRNTALSMRAALYNELRIDIGMSYEDSEKVFEIDPLIGNLPQTYALQLGRIDSLHSSYRMSHYTAGVLLTEAAHRFTGIDRYLPIPDLSRDDLILLEGQLDELAAIAIQESLTIIDPVTLSEGVGEPISL